MNFLYYVKNENDMFDVILNTNGTIKVIINNISIEKATKWINNIKSLFGNNLENISNILDENNMIDKDLFIDLLMDCRQVKFIPDENKKQEVYRPLSPKTIGIGTVEIPDFYKRTFFYSY